jgi:hypothetical protein
MSGAAVLDRWPGFESAPQRHEAVSAQRFVFSHARRVAEAIRYPSEVLQKLLFGILWASWVLRLNRIVERTLDAPSAAKPRGDDAQVLSFSVTELRERDLGASKFDEPCAPLVGHLFPVCGPPTISGLVVALWVDAINRMSVGGTRAHVGIERLKRPTPAGADPNADCAVFGVCSLSLVIAAVLNRAPRSVFDGLRHAVPARDSAGAFLLDTSAGLSRSGSHVPGANGLRLAAIALTARVVVAPNEVRRIDYHEASESFADREH